MRWNGMGWDGVDRARRSDSPTALHLFIASLLLLLLLLLLLNCFSPFFRGRDIDMMCDMIGVNGIYIYIYTITDESC